MDDMHKEETLDASTVLEQLKLINHWDNQVLILMPDRNEYFVDGQMELYLSAEEFAERIHEMPKEQKMAYSKIPMLFAIDTVCKHECKGMLLHGFEEGDIYIAKEELLPLQEYTDLIYIFQAMKEQKITVKRAIQLLDKKIFYMLGDIPTAVNVEDDLYSFDITNAKGTSYDSVKLYFTRERAEAYNVRNFEIHRHTFGELAKSFRNRYGLSIEPQQSFTAVFAPDEI